MLATLASFKKLRILCTREYQNSIKDSVYKILVDQIEELKLTPYYNILKTEITSKVGSEFLFKGLQHPLEIKSIEGIDIVWLEEAQNVSEESWQFLIPTIRKEGSEIWMSLNTGSRDDPTYKRFVANPPEDCVMKLLTFRDNPYFPDTLRKEMEYCKRVDMDEIKDIADDGTNDTYEYENPKTGKVETRVDFDHIKRSALRVDTRKWLASHLLPRKFSDRVQLTGAEGKDLIPASTTPTKVIIKFVEKKADE